MQNIEKNLTQVREQIVALAERYGRNSGDVRLLAVSKKKSLDDIRKAYSCGQLDFGENYLQEAQQKIEALDFADISWHFIGALQSNKTATVARLFDWVHCVDRLKIAQRLGAQRPPGLALLNVCIQVNLDAEQSKAGITLQQLPSLAQQVNRLPGLRLRGLMAIPAPRSDLDQQRAVFRRLNTALSELQSSGINCDTLSMGMSNDMPAAIAEGSTIVRIGTAIFGERQ